MKIIYDVRRYNKLKLEKEWSKWNNLRRTFIAENERENHFKNKRCKKMLNLIDMALENTSLSERIIYVYNSSKGFRCIFEDLGIGITKVKCALVNGDTFDVTMKDDELKDYTNDIIIDEKKAKVEKWIITKNNELKLLHKIKYRELNNAK